MIENETTNLYEYTNVCGGVIIDRKNILTSAHCILDDIDSATNNSFFIKASVNYTVYVGLQDKSNLYDLQYPTVEMSVKKAIRVSFFFV